MIPRKLFYWGNNGIHEFWESEDHELLILRNHGESHWTAHRNMDTCSAAVLKRRRLLA
jgi:hypothetical protein